MSNTEEPTISFVVCNRDDGDAGGGGPLRMYAPKRKNNNQSNSVNSNITPPNGGGYSSFSRGNGMQQMPEQMHALEDMQASLADDAEAGEGTNSRNTDNDHLLRHVLPTPLCHSQPRRRSSHSLTTWMTVGPHPLPSKILMTRNDPHNNKMTKPSHSIIS